ncbi:unnamed protein product, partial [Mesorhabditis spiculigera]
MKEFEQHIVDVSKQLGCSFADDELVLEQWTTENRFEFLYRCLWKIDPEFQGTLSSWKFPENIAGRFTKATNLANAIKEAGVRREFGHQTLLYGGLTDVVPLFLDLIERIPKNEAFLDVITSYRDQKLAQACANIRPSWVPEFCRRLMMSFDGRYWYPKEGFPEYVSPFQAVDYWKAIESGGDSREWVAALIRVGGLDGHSGKLVNLQATTSSGPPIAAKPKLKPTPPPKPKIDTHGAETEARLTQKKKQLEQLRSELDDIKMNIVQGKCESMLIEDKMEPLKAAMAEQDERWVTLLENPVDGQAKLQKALDDSEARSQKLENKWKITRDEKLAVLEELKQRSENSAEIERLCAKTKEAITKREQLLEDSDVRQAYLIRLQKRLEKLESDDCDRMVFTRRITEIVNNIRKQQEDIEKVKKDITGLHKEIRWLQLTINRSFDLIEEPLFQETPNSMKGERIYKNFNKIHKTCNKAMECLRKQSKIARIIEHLTDRVEIGRQSTVDSQLEQVLADLEQVEKEREQLSAFAGSQGSTGQ